MRFLWAPRSVAEVGRLEERWRWKLTGGIGPGPRESALADVPDEVVGGEWKNVPKKLLSPSLWSRVYCGRVQDENAPIHLKEAEAALFVVKHIVRGSNDGQGKRHLILGDSMTLSYELGKARASNPRLLAIARKWACISMAGDLLLVYRWIPSVYNVADRDSRRWDEDDLPCETNDKSCSSDLKPIVAKCDGSLSPLIEDASPWTEFCSQQIPKTWKRVRRGRKPQRAPIRRLVRWEPVGGCGGASLRTVPSARGPISLRTPRLCRTIQVSRVVEKVPGLSFLESNAVAPGTMDSYRKAVTDLEMFTSEIGQRLDWKNGVEVERTCLEYLDLLFTQGFGPEVGNRLIAAIRTLFPRYSRHGDLDMPRTVKAMKGRTRLTLTMSW